MFKDSRICVAVHKGLHISDGVPADKCTDPEQRV